MKNIIRYPFFLLILISGCSGPKTAQSLIDPSALNGTWEVVEMPVTTTVLKELYPQKKPSITFDAVNQKISGSTGCNSFNGSYEASGARIDFSAPLGMTRMMCPGEGESLFVNSLQNVNGWTVREETLRLMAGDLVVMHLKKVSVQ